MNGSQLAILALLVACVAGWLNATVRPRGTPVTWKDHVAGVFVVGYLFLLMYLLGGK